MRVREKEVERVGEADGVEGFNGTGEIAPCRCVAGCTVDMPTSTHGT